MRSQALIWLAYLQSEQNIQKSAHHFNLKDKKQQSIALRMKSSKGKGPANGSRPPKKGFGLPPTTPGKQLRETSSRPKDPVEVYIKNENFQN